MLAADVKRCLVLFMDTEREIDNEIERLEILQEKLYSVGSPEITDMPRNPSPSNDRISELLSRKNDCEKKVGHRLELQRKRRVVYEHVVEKISGPDKRSVIGLRYLEGVRWDRICESLFGQQDDYDDRRDTYMRRVMRLHGWALQDMAGIIESEGLEDEFKA